MFSFELKKEEMDETLAGRCRKTVFIPFFQVFTSQMTINKL